ARVLCCVNVISPQRRQAHHVRQLGRRGLTRGAHAMIDWWSDTEHAVIDALDSAGPMSPQDLAQRVGISEGEAIAYLCMRAKEKKVAIQLVGLTSPLPGRVSRKAGRHREKAPVVPEPAYAGGH